MKRKEEKEGKGRRELVLCPRKKRKLGAYGLPYSHCGQTLCVLRGGCGRGEDHKHTVILQVNTYDIFCTAQPDSFIILEAE